MATRGLLSPRPPTQTAPNARQSRCASQPSPYRFSERHIHHQPDGRGSRKKCIKLAVNAFSVTSEEGAWDLLTKHDPDTTARVIIERLLRRTSQAMLANDFADLNACFALPLTIETAETKLEIRTEDEHKRLFQRMVEGYQSKGVTDIIRVCEVAEFVTPTLIRSLHVSHLMSRNLRIEEPMPTLATTELIDGIWRITSAQYAASNRLPVGRAISKSATGKTTE